MGRLFLRCPGSLVRSGALLLLLVVLPLTASAGPQDLPAPGPQPYRWVVECIDCAKQFAGMSGQSLRLDSAGQPHVAFGADHLYHAWYDGASWFVETVDDAFMVGEYAALALDDNDHPHISYYDGLQQDLKYAYRDDAGWHVETVDSEADAGHWTSIAWDEEGDVHIGYGTRYPDPFAPALKVAHRNDSDWQIEVVDDHSFRLGPTSLVVDAMGSSHISYLGEEHGVIRYSFRDDAGWREEIVYATTSVHPHSSLALDPSGQVHIALCNVKEWALVHGLREESGWQFEIADAVGSVGAYPSIAMDADGQPHISYVDVGNADLKYAYRNDAGWHIGQVADEERPRWFSHTSLALDGEGRPQISYSGTDVLILKHASWSGAAWDIETVARGGGRRSGVSLAIDRRGRPQVSYSEASEGLSGGGQIYAQRDGEGWHAELVESEANVPAKGAGSSLVLDAKDQPHIAFDDYPDGVTHAYREGQGWRSETLLIPGQWLLFPALALDAEDHAHIAVYDYSGEALRFADWRDDGWQVETVDSDRAAGWHPALMLGSDGQPQICYGLYRSDGRDYHPDDLRYARLDAEGWQVETIDYNITAAGRAYLRLDGNDYPHIVYQDPAGNLRYARRDSTGWHMEVVETEGAPGAFNMLSVDGQGRAHITYFDTQAAALMVAYRDPYGWHNQTASTQVGYCSEVAGSLDSRGLAHTACSTGRANDLLYIYARSKLVYVPLMTGVK